MMIQRMSWALGLCCVCAVVGCGAGDMGEVSGTVTMDGQPLPGAMLQFTPVSGDRPSVGRTDENGYYEMKYTFNASGVKVGDSTVSISTYSEGLGGPPAPENVPKKYNTETTLKVTVEPGNNEFDFDLDSQGEIATYEKTVDE